MNIFFWRGKKNFFTDDEMQLIAAKIRLAEQQTSGEIRVFVESHCRYVDPVDRAREIFFRFRMEETQQRNATLIYIAVKDHQVALFGDVGIHEKVGQSYWEEEVARMLIHFREHHLVDGLCQCITDIGEALRHHFPYDRNTDKNELPDDIIFGR